LIWESAREKKPEAKGRRYEEEHESKRFPVAVLPKEAKKGGGTIPASGPGGGGGMGEC